MKKLLPIVMAVIIGLSSFAQQTTQTKPKVNPALANKTLQMKPGKIFDLPLTTKPAGNVHFKKATPPKLLGPTETVIGNTTYDLQSNGCVANRVTANADGTIQASWTFSAELNAAWNDRGSGYNYFNGTAWGAAPTARIEGGARTGWPEMVSLGNGSEVVIAHAPALNLLLQSSRTQKGTGTWNTIDLSDLAPGSILWPRAVSGGLDGNSIHLIAHNEATTVVNGITGMVYYSRSLDGGNTWDKKSVLIPGFDNTNYAYLSADDYAIAAKGNTVVIALFGQLSRTLIVKSTDNGNTWTSRMVFDMPFIYDPNSSNTSGSVIGISDINGDQIPDTVESTDGVGAVVIDNNGVAHLFWGIMRFLDDTPGDGSWSYFPGTNGIGYWNENMGNIAPQFIAGALDVDGSGVLLDDYDPNGGIDIALYYTSLTSQPNAAVDASGNLYLVYSGVVETLNQGSQFYRHVYGIKSTDGGCTWSLPIDLTSSDDFSECVFPSMAHNTAGGNIHFTYQRDGEPGLNLQGDEDAVGVNDYIYVEESVSVFSSTMGALVTGILAEITSFCPGDSVLLTAYCGKSWQWSTGATTQSIYAKNYTTYLVTITDPSVGSQVESITMTSITSGNPPVVTVSAFPAYACPGETVILSTNNVSSASWNWSTTDSAQTITVTDTGTYTVDVTNCGGTTTASIYVGVPLSAPVAIITGEANFCPGDSAELTANPGGYVTYEWSTGDTTPSIFASVIGAYTVSITNCIGTGTATVNVTNTPLPVAVITASGATSFCEGESVSLTASGAGTGGSYVWSPGSETTQGITVNQEGDYSVVATNACGDLDTSSVTSVIVFPNPPVPTITKSDDGTGNILLVSSSATGNQWYKNDTIIASATNDTLILSWQELAGDSIYVIVTNDKNCTSTSASIIPVPTGINSAYADGGISIYPNPNDGQFTVAFSNAPSDKYAITLKNILGQVIYTEQASINGNAKMNINLSAFDKGIYFLTVSDSQKEQTHKVVVK